MPRPPVAWTGWRGPHRDGRAAWLPDRLSPQFTKVWEHRLSAAGLGGIAATVDHVFVTDRELDDTVDCFKCLSSRDGSEVWAVRFPIKGELDYGNSPRATPLIHDGLVFFLGAFGHLHCVEIRTGDVLWQMDIRDEFDADDVRKWGVCSSPLIVDEKLIVNPGAKAASLVALDPRTGKVIWKSPGAAASYGSFLAGTFGGVKQLVGYDATTLGGWDVATGRRLWSLKPERPNDFNVPTPIKWGERLIVTTENNGTRMYRFHADGRIDPKPIATHDDLAPDSHTPVIDGDRLFGIWGRLYCLNLKDGLQTIWEGEDEAYSSYGSLIVADGRLLATTLEGELLLIDARGERPQVLGRMKLFDNERGLYSHPALVGSRLYVRRSSSLVCIDLPQ